MPRRRRPDAPTQDEQQALRPEDEEGAAILRERGPGTHEEQISDEANLREDPSPPDPDADRED
jgi:hypothetical protein